MSDSTRPSFAESHRPVDAASSVCKKKVFSFQRSYNRVKAVISATTEEQVAREFGVSRFVIAENRKNRTFPSDWLEILLCRHRVLPLWVLFGIEPRFLKPTFPLNAAEINRLLAKADEALARAPRSVSTVKIF